MYFQNFLSTLDMSQSSLITLVAFIVCCITVSSAATLTIPYNRLMPLMKRPRAPSYPLLLGSESALSAEEDPQMLSQYGQVAASNLDPHEDLSTWETLDDPRFFVLTDNDRNLDVSISQYYFISTV